MIIRLHKYDLEAKPRVWVPQFPTKFFSLSSRIRKGYRLDASCRFQYPYGRGDVVAPTSLAKWVD